MTLVGFGIAKYSSFFPHRFSLLDFLGFFRVYNTNRTPSDCGLWGRIPFVLVNGSSALKQPYFLKQISFGLANLNNPRSPHASEK
jgi:hypothetical protein